jgi:hypothetical protein
MSPCSAVAEAVGGEGASQGNPAFFRPQINGEGIRTTTDRRTVGRRGFVILLAVYARLPCRCYMRCCSARSLAQSLTELTRRVSPSSAAAQSITGGGRGRGSWSNGQMVSPKPELDTGRGEQATDKGWHGSPVVLVLSAFPLTDTHTIYHSLYAGSKGKFF